MFVVSVVVVAVAVVVVVVTLPASDKKCSHQAETLDFLKKFSGSQTLETFLKGGGQQPWTH
jgi:uncharacterized protein YoxC